MSFFIIICMNYKTIGLAILILMAFVSVSAVFSADSPIVDGLNSTTNFTQALNDAGVQNKTVLLIFDQDSCYYCDLLKKDVLSNANVQKQLEKDFIVVDIDITKQPQIASKYKVMGTPTSVFLDSKGNEVQRIEGYVSAGEFLNLIKEI